MKKILILLCAVLMVAALCACDGNAGIDADMEALIAAQGYATPKATATAAPTDTIPAPAPAPATPAPVPATPAADGDVVAPPADAPASGEPSGEPTGEPPAPPTT